MSTKYSPSFKVQVVEKVLNRSSDTSIESIANDLGVSRSAISAWIYKSRNNELESVNSTMQTKEKRPQDWSLEERLNMVISCASLDKEKMNAYCREQGVYAHHVNQWKQDFSNGYSSTVKVQSEAEIRQLKNETKALKKELNRKDKALAETAALLVLQKKVAAIWGSNEDDLQ